jgi:hypothetical protein
MDRWPRWVVVKRCLERLLATAIVRGRHRGELLRESEPTVGIRVPECTGRQRRHTQQGSKKTAGHGGQHLLAQRDITGRAGVGLLGARGGRGHGVGGRAAVCGSEGAAAAEGLCGLCGLYQAEGPLLADCKGRCRSGMWARGVEGIVWRSDGGLQVVTMASGRFDATKVNYRTCKLLARHVQPRPPLPIGPKGAELIRWLADCMWRPSWHRRQCFHAPFFHPAPLHARPLGLFFHPHGFKVLAAAYSTVLLLLACLLHCTTPHCTALRPQHLSP